MSWVDLRCRSARAAFGLRGGGTLQGHQSTIEPTAVRLMFAGVAAVFAALAVAVLVQAPRHPLALRADHQGVTLGPEPGFTHQGFWWRASEITLTWHDIEAVVHFSRDYTVAAFSDYIGLRLRDRAQQPPPPGAQRSMLGFTRS